MAIEIGVCSGIGRAFRSRIARSAAGQNVLVAAADYPRTWKFSQSLYVHRLRSGRHDEPFLPAKHERTVASSSGLDNPYVRQSSGESFPSSFSRSGRSSPVGVRWQGSLQDLLSLWKSERDGILARRRYPYRCACCCAKFRSGSKFSLRLRSDRDICLLIRGTQADGQVPVTHRRRGLTRRSVLEGRTKREIDCGAEASQPGCAGHYRR